jgi:hypothetical protein
LGVKGFVICLQSQKANFASRFLNAVSQALAILVQETYFLAARVREKEQWETDCWKLAGSVISKLLLIKNHTSGAVKTFAECL